MKEMRPQSSSREKSKNKRPEQPSKGHPNILKSAHNRKTTDFNEKSRSRNKVHYEERVASRNTNRHRKEGFRDESYEELSRKKRKIESELHALDLEEAASKSVESKKVKKCPLEPVRVKEEKEDNPVEATTHEERKKEKEKPDFSVSGKLAEDTNVYNGVVIKYNEPAEARKPHRRWRLYPFKGDSDLPFIPIHRQSAYLFGRTRSIADIPIDHPSCSKQHAVLQFRLVPYKREDGTSGRRVRPCIIDLDSSNGTFVNNKRIDPRRYVELIEKDVVKFGYSSREYVLLHEESKNDDDDDVRDSN